MPFTRNFDCELYYETFGSPTDPALLLVNGLGSQSINYADAWCEKFVARGFRVIRFDNRDVGLSTHFADAPVGERGEAYTLSDMADDAIAVLDANDVERAHVMGVSMGGMIVQTLAIEHPDRLLSVTSVMSHTGEPDRQWSTPEAWAHLTRPPARNRDEYVAGHVTGLRIWGSPAFADDDRWRADAGRAFDRCFDPSGTRRQFVAIEASAPRADLLRTVDLPFLVIHGDRDTLIGVEGGRRTAELVPGARLEVIEGMGHDYPPQLWDGLVALVGEFALG
ncbi:MAG TPA: alpha/beta hydrolase [Ilumatobacteraceae bacterium]|nr:alpha/beta hydrolase [Ilumatobacteraceae bacterium]